MKISDLTEEQIHIGIRIRSLADNNLLGTIIERMELGRGDENPWIIRWDDENKPTSGFCFNDCECEVVEETL